MCVCVLDFGRSNGHAVVSHCGFNLQFPLDVYCGVSLYNVYLSSEYLLW